MARKPPDQRYVQPDPQIDDRPRVDRGLGFGIYVFPHILQETEAGATGGQHDLHLKGTINFKGYWENTGWSDEAVIPLMSEILMPMADSRISPGPYVMGGIAFGGRHGVSQVEVSIDGKEWQKAELKAPLSMWAWTLWRYAWTPSHQGRFSLRVRAYDRSGRPQESGSLLGHVLGSYPDGARGIENIDVRVTE